jgi:very-short-patch-repair endonuclease
MPPMGAAGLQDDPTAIDSLERHRLRRAQNIPTVTVLLGPPTDAIALWDRWLATSGRTGVASRQADRTHVVDEWLSEDRFARRFADAFVASAARALGLPVEELRVRLRTKGEPELAGFVSRLAAAVWCSTDVARLAVDIERRRDPNTIRAALTEVSEVLVPAVRFAPLSPLLLHPAAASASVAQAIETVTSLAEALPQADLGIAVSGDSLHEWQLEAVPRIRAIVAEGIVRVSLPPRREPSDPPPIGMARSDAERRLYECLQLRQRTRDLFALNTILPDPVDPTPLEVDLCCERLRLVVEVDGYHHFRSPEDFRRDRRKDLRLQQLGYVVVRVLASDVVEEVDYVLQMIDAAMDRRREAR